jgi:hypothetical protein
LNNLLVDFCLTFVYHYIAFKSRKREYLGLFEKGNFARAKQAAVKEGLEYLLELIEGVEYAVRNKQLDILWEIAREAPKIMAFRQREFIVQMIDEFQFMNTMIYWDKRKKNLTKNLAGGYLSTAENKIAPLLVSGSWVGWLMSQLIMMPARFKYKSLKNMTEPEAVEMVFKYSRFFQVPITEETAYLLVELSEGNPFYMSAVIRSEDPNKNLTTIDGLTRTLEFETLDDHGIIKSTWMEYMARAFLQINDQNAKNIVLHLSKHRDRKFTREDILMGIKLEMSDKELEKKLKALVMADIINQGTSNYRYRGVNDNIFARSQSPADYSIVGEVKSRDLKKFSKDEVITFEKKFAELKKMENIERVQGFIFSRSGFTKDAEDYCKEKGIACSEDDQWLESGKLKSPLV